MTSKVHNPRGYAYVAFKRSYQRHRTYAWFATIRGARIGPKESDWVRDGLAMFDRMVFGIDATDEDEIRELVGEIEIAMSRSAAYCGRGRILWPNSRTGREGSDRVSLTLDQSPAERKGHLEAAGNETEAELIPDPSDPIAEYDDWDEFKWRLRQLWPLLTEAERRYVAAQIDDPGANPRELAERFGQTRSMADLMMRRTRKKAKTLAKNDAFYQLTKETS